jgi:hypothetical protein
VAVLVSARALPAGATLGPDDIALREVPAALVPAALVADPAEVAALAAAGPGARTTPSSTWATAEPSDPAGAEPSDQAPTEPSTPIPLAPADLPSDQPPDPASAEPSVPATVARPGPAATGTHGPAAATPSTPAAIGSPNLASAEPSSAAPADATDLRSASALIGRRLAVDVPAGLPLVPGLLVDPSATPPAGTVVVPVRFADPAIAALLAPGTRVDVVAAPTVDGAAPERVARDALVLSGPGCTVGDGAGSAGTDSGAAGVEGRPGDGTAAGDDRSSTGDDPRDDAADDGGRCEAQDGPVLLAVPPDTAVLLSGTSASAVLAAVIVG